MLHFSVKWELVEVFQMAMSQLLPGLQLAHAKPDK